MHVSHCTGRPSHPICRGDQTLRGLSYVLYGAYIGFVAVYQITKILRRQYLDIIIKSCSLIKLLIREASQHHVIKLALHIS